MRRKLWCLSDQTGWKMCLSCKTSPLPFFFKKASLFKVKTSAKPTETREDQQLCSCFGFFFPGNFRYYWLSGFVSLMRGWKMVKYAVKFWMQRKYDIYSFRVLSLSADEFKMKSNSMKLLFPLKVFCLLSWRIVCWYTIVCRDSISFGVSVPFDTNNNFQSWKKILKDNSKRSLIYYQLWSTSWCLRTVQFAVYNIIKSQNAKSWIIQSQPPIPFAGIPPIRPGCLRPCPTWLRTLTGVGHQPPWAAWAPDSPHQTQRK